MSKYTEAETKIKKIMCEEIDRLPSHFDGEDEVYDSTKDVDEILKLNKIICKALQIADRVEQIWEEVKDKEFPHSMFQNCRDCGDYMQGKKDALADIRGEVNE